MRFALMVFVFLAIACFALAQEVIPRPSDVANQAEAIKQPRTVQVPQGFSVEVSPMPEIAVTFSNVDKAGTLTSQVAFEGPKPAPGYLVGELPIFVNLSTSAEYKGAVKVCIHYAPALFPDQAADLRILRFREEGCVDETRTLDREKHIACAEMPKVGLLLLAVRSLEGLYEDLALTVRQIPNDETKQDLAEPLLKSREAALKGDREAFGQHLSTLRAKVQNAPPEKVFSQFSEWIQYFLNRIEARVNAR